MYRFPNYSRKQPRAVYWRTFIRSQDCAPASACSKPTQRRFLHIPILTPSTTGFTTGIHCIMWSFVAGISAFPSDFAVRQSRSTHMASYKWEGIQEVTTSQKQPRESLNATVGEDSSGITDWTLAQIFHTCCGGVSSQEERLICQSGIGSLFWIPCSPKIPPRPGVGVSVSCCFTVPVSLSVSLHSHHSLWGALSLVPCRYKTILGITLPQPFYFNNLNRKPPAISKWRK